jgi:DNA-binding transcriptional MocR family regulator
MPAYCSSQAVFDAALEQGILISPGLLYSNSNRFDHFLRINCGAPYTAEIEQAIKVLSNIVQHLLRTRKAVA